MGGSGGSALSPPRRGVDHPGQEGGHGDSDVERDEHRAGGLAVADLDGEEGPAEGHGEGQACLSPEARRVEDPVVGAVEAEALEVRGRPDMDAHVSVVVVEERGGDEAGPPDVGALGVRAPENGAHEADAPDLSRSCEHGDVDLVARAEVGDVSHDVVLDERMEVGVRPQETAEGVHAAFLRLVVTEEVRYAGRRDPHRGGVPPVADGGQDDRVDERVHESAEIRGFGARGGHGERWREGDVRQAGDSLAASETARTLPNRGSERCSDRA